MWTQIARSMTVMLYISKVYGSMPLNPVDYIGRNIFVCVFYELWLIVRYWSSVLGSVECPTCGALYVACWLNHQLILHCWQVSLTGQSCHPQNLLSPSNVSNISMRSLSVNLFLSWPVIYCWPVFSHHYSVTISLFSWKPLNWEYGSGICFMNCVFFWYSAVTVSNCWRVC